MKNIVDKLRAMELEMAEEKGQFLLFALFLREDAPDVWDLLVSAPWIIKNKSDSLRYIARKVREALNSDELLKLSRIVLIEENNPALEALHRAIQIEHGTAEIQNSNFFGMPIKHAYLITSKRDASKVPAEPGEATGQQQKELSRGCPS